MIAVVKIFKNLLSLLFIVEFNNFLGPDTYLLHYPAPREFWSTESVMKINASLLRRKGGWLVLNGLWPAS